MLNCCSFLYFFYFRLRIKRKRTIIDLNDYCLVKYLDHDDLVRIVDSDIRFKIAASFVFKKKYGNFFGIIGNTEYLYSDFSSLDASTDVSKVNGFRDNANETNDNVQIDLKFALETLSNEIIQLNNVNQLVIVTTNYAQLNQLVASNQLENRSLLSLNFAH